MTAILLPPGLLENDVEGGLLFDGRSGGSPCGGSAAATATGAAALTPHFSSSCFHQVSDLQNSKRAELIHEVLCVCHFFDSWYRRTPKPQGI